MFPTYDLVIAAEHAYRRERMLATRPSRRTRRAHKVRHHRPSRGGLLQRLTASRTAPDGTDCLCPT